MTRIEKDIPMPPERRGTARGSEKRAIWRKMKVGESILVTGKSAITRAAKWTYTAKQGGLRWQFSSRKTDEGYRVWRVR